ncbi:DUF6445 family protein [Sphingomonas sp. CROZ-RG-20F-R02-07]|uniref:DUF6445 family protein n=1 Tax=Sphingomonas sp. CROZ-RG-20F-R02-07 TaxID=2914832 RepID=UPI001F5A9145|nr:DUF6445 family protein [Sphingomonas sp. CROZ-RG-20F-R02-07]
MTIDASPKTAFAFSPDARIAVHHLGREREPVVMADQASGHAAGLVDFAATRSAFSAAETTGGGYPGLLGTAPIAYVNAMVAFALPLIARHFDTGPVAPVRARGNFSLVTTPPERLSPDQRWPHVDAADRWLFAAVHYLSPHVTAGTGFFRHRDTGFETIDQDRLPAYRSAYEADVQSAAGHGYVTADNALFDPIGRIDAAFDRFILYRAALLHSGMIDTLPAFPADPRRGRLTGNLFLQVRRR